MKKPFIAGLLLLLLAANSLQAQEREEEEKERKGFQKENLFIGGNFGLSFGNTTFINISPQLGYRFNQYVAAGFGINGQYLSYRERFNGVTYRRVSQGVAGLNVFGRVYPIPQVMLQAQPEANYIFGKQTFYDTNPRSEFKMDAEIVPSLLLGGGAVLPQGRGALVISVMYDVLQRDYSPYGKRPIYNFGYNIGLY